MIIMLVGLMFGIAYFTTATWPLYIDLVVFPLLIILISAGGALVRGEAFSERLLYKGMAGAFSGALSFLLVYLWGELTISGFWYFASLIVGAVSGFIPGGHSIALFLGGKFGWFVSISGWMYIVTIVLDILSLLAIILVFFKKKKSNSNIYYR